MPKLLAIVVAVLLASCSRSDHTELSGCSAVAKANECTRGDVCRVPLVALLTAPSCYNGKIVNTSGYVAHQKIGTRLYMTREAASEFLSDQSLQLELVPGTEGAPVFAGPDRYLWIIGEFKIVGSGISLMRISRLGSIASEKYQ